MVKKLKYLLLIFPFLFILNVNAQTMSTPTSYYYETSDGTPNFVNTSLDLWWGTNTSTDYYYHSARLGDFGSSTPRIYRVDFNFVNANLCSGKELMISGYVGSAGGTMFDDVSYDIQVYNNSSRMICSFTKIGGNKLQYSCSGKGGGNLAFYFFENSFITNQNYSPGVNRNIDITCDVNNQQIVDQSIINSQNIINNQNSTTNQIIQDNQQNTQDIINNQNQNTQQEIESQKVCTFIDKNNIKTQNSALNPNGSITTSNTNDWGITDYIKINSSTLEKLSTYGNNYSFCFYNVNKTLISCNTNGSTNIGLLTIPTNASFVRFSIYKPENKPQYKLCTNGNQALNDSVNSLNDTLNDTSQPNTNQDISDMENMVSSDTPISDLITMPLTLINAYINGVNSSCSPVNLGSLYGSNLILPCINLEQRLGSNLWHIIDVFFSIFMCYNIGMLFITAFDGITSLRDDFEGLYQPRHADTGYKPKHGG